MRRQLGAAGGSWVALCLLASCGVREPTLGGTPVTDPFRPPPPTSAGAFTDCSPYGWCFAPSLASNVPEPPARSYPPPPPVPDYDTVVDLGGARFLAAGTRLDRFSLPAEWPPVAAAGFHLAVHAAWRSPQGTLYFAGDSGHLIVGTSKPQLFVTPTSLPLRAVFGYADDDVFVAGDGNAVYHYDGNSLSEMQSSPPWPVHGLWGSAGSGLWAAGAGGRLWLYDEQRETWLWHTSPTRLDLNAIAGRASDDIWAVGAAGVIVHWDGAKWLAVTTPTARDLRGLWIGGSGEGFAVGDDGTVLSLSGGVWSVVPCALHESLHAVVANPDLHEAWAVGTSGTIVNGWAYFDAPPQPLPRPHPPDPDIPPPTVAGVRSLVVDPSSWQLWIGTDIGLMTLLDMQSLHVVPFRATVGGLAAGGAQVFAATSRGTMLLPDFLSLRGAFSSVSAPASAIWAAAPDDAWFTTTDGLRHWDGHFAGLWEIDGTRALAAVGGSSSDDVWAVGSGGRIVRWDPALRTWKASLSGTSVDLNGVWVESPGDAWVVGAGGIILHWDGAAWRQESSGVAARLWAVAGVSSGIWSGGRRVVVTVGDGGTVVVRRGSEWHLEHSGTTASLDAITIADPWVFAGGEGRALLRKELARWP